MNKGKLKACLLLSDKAILSWIGRLGLHQYVSWNKKCHIWKVRRYIWELLQRPNMWTLLCLETRLSEADKSSECDIDSPDNIRSKKDQRREESRPKPDLRSVKDKNIGTMSSQYSEKVSLS